jgi:hypothetical protein
MGRRFLIGAATALVVLLLGLRLESRLPDAAGPGEETVTVHGLCVYRRGIQRADAGEHSPWPALLAAAGAIVAGSVLAGAMVATFGRRPGRQNSDDRVGP